MANKKISELDSRASLSLSDLMAVGDPATGYLYKTTISDLKTLTGAGVVSFNGRVGAIVPTEADYNLTQLGDVIITSVTSGQFLRYNGSNFVNTGLSASDIPDLSATYQPLDADLTAIAALSSTGILKRTGANTWSLLTDNTANWDTAYADRNKWDGGSTGLVAATGRTSLGLVIGTDVQAWDADLDAIAALTGTSGFLKKSAANTWFLDTNTYLTTAAGANTYEPIITAGTTAQYWRGDKSWQTLNTTAVAEGTNLYYTDARARGAISASTGISYNSTTGAISTTITQYTDALARASVSLTTTGSSGAATYNSTTGAFNIPNYTLSGLGGEPAIAAGTTAQYWRGDKTWQTLPSYSLPIASATVLGGIKVGSNLSINATTGVLDATFTYTLPVATTSVLGGVKIGTGIGVDVNGVISVTGVQSQLNGTGFVKASGTTISYDNTSYLPLTGGTLSNILYFSGTDSTARVLPSTDNTGYIGESTHRWKGFYGTDINLNGTSNVLGTITSGIWNGSAITDSYISSAATWNAKAADNAVVHLAGTETITGVKSFVITNNWYSILIDNGSGISTPQGAIFLNHYPTVSTKYYSQYAGNWASPGSWGMGVRGSADSTIYLGQQSSGVIDPTITIDLQIGQYLAVKSNRTLTINGTSYDLSANRSWTIPAGVSGSGTAGKIPKWSTTTALADSLISDNGNQITISSADTQVLQIYGDSTLTNGSIRFQIDEVNDSYGTGTRAFIGDTGIDIFIGTGNSSYTPSNNNSYIALNAAGEISMGAGSSTLIKQFILNTDYSATLSCGATTTTYGSVLHVSNGGYGAWVQGSTDGQTHAFFGNF